MTAATSPLRWVRAWVLGVSSVALGVGGHAAGGGHIEPVFVLILAAAASVGAYAWLRQERGLAAVLATVVAAQVITHATLTLGHEHTASAAMLLGHALAAIALAILLRFGEAWIFERARRRYLAWLIAVRCALAGLRPRPTVALISPYTLILDTTRWLLRAVDGRGPPVAACC